MSREGACNMSTPTSRLADHAGDNIFAAEVHQASLTSTDLTFDATASYVTPPSLALWPLASARLCCDAHVALLPSRLLVLQVFHAALC